MRQGYVAQNFKIYVGYGDNRGDFDKGSCRMEECTNLYSTICKYAIKIFDTQVDKTRPIRKIGYEFYNLSHETAIQYNLFTDRNKIEKETRLVKSVLNLQDKYGKNAVLKGLDLRKNATQRERNRMIGGHNGY